MATVTRSRAAAVRGFHDVFGAAAKFEDVYDLAFDSTGNIIVATQGYAGRASYAKRLVTTIMESNWK